jgi:hypothetical protein
LSLPRLKYFYGGTVFNVGQYGRWPGIFFSKICIFVKIYF